MTSVDAYTWRARLMPAALASVPAVALLLAGAVRPTVAASPVAIVLGAVGIVVAGVVRDLGRRLQPGLWASWGGSPTVRRLRWRGTADRRAVERLHRRLSPVLSEQLPTAAEEEADPAAADRRYEGAVAELRALTRDASRFPLVFAENVQYGFRRNCLGLRPVAIAIAGVAYVSAIALAVAGGEPRFVVAAVIALACAGAWWRFVGERWVRDAGELYAAELLESSASLLGRDAPAG